MYQQIQSRTPPVASLFPPTHIQKSWTELQNQLQTSIPMTLSLTLYRIPWLLSLHFVGAIGSNELAAAALATTVCNVTGISVAEGLNSAMTTLCGQARGRRLKRQRRRRRQYFLAGVVGDDDGSDDDPIVFFYRGVFVQLGLVTPVGIYWIRGVKNLLMSLGQDELLSEMTEQYLRILAPGLWAYSLNWCLVSYLQTLEMADVPLYAAVLGNILHIPINLFFIKKLGLGYHGVALATTVFQMVQPLTAIWYLWYTPMGRQRLHSAGGDPCISHTIALKCALGSVRGLRQYLSLALPGLVVISEWWASEIAIFWAGWISPVALAGMSLYQSLNALCYLFSEGASVGGSARVGRALGEGHVSGAALSAWVSVCHAAIVSGTCGAILFCMPNDFFPHVFTHDAGVVAATATTIPFLAFYVVADGLQVAFDGVVKGCGKQWSTVPVVIVAYWAIGLPVGYHLAFRCGMGVVGLVAGMTIGTYTHCVLIGILIGATDWKLEGEKAQRRLHGNYKSFEEEHISLLGDVKVEAI